MAALTRPSVLVADPANFLKANGAAYIRVGSIVMAAYEYVLTKGDSRHPFRAEFTTTQLCLDITRGVALLQWAAWLEDRVWLYFVHSH